MSEKFPQRFFVPRKEDMQEVIHVYDIFKHYPGDIEYLSLQEHNQLLSQLEERLRVARSDALKEAAQIVACLFGVGAHPACPIETQKLYVYALEEAAIKEKK